MQSNSVSQNNDPSVRREDCQASSENDLRSLIPGQVYYVEQGYNRPLAIPIEARDCIWEAAMYRSDVDYTAYAIRSEFYLTVRALMLAGY